MEPENQNLANTPEMTNETPMAKPQEEAKTSAPQVAKQPAPVQQTPVRQVQSTPENETPAFVQPVAQEGDKPGTNTPRAESQQLPPGSPLSNDLGPLDARVVPPYHRL